MSDVELDKPVQYAENSVGNICHSGQFGDLSVCRMLRATNLWSLVINLLQYKQLEGEVARSTFPLSPVSYFVPLMRHTLSNGAR